MDSTDFQMPSEILGCVMTNVIDGTEEIESSDDQLMEAVVNRKSEALECIYMRYESLLRAVILGVIRDESEVDDILHDVLLQVWEQGDRYNPNERGLRGLLVTLARRRALDRLRRRAAYRRATEGLKNDVDNPLINEITTTTSHLENSDFVTIARARDSAPSGSSKRGHSPHILQRTEPTRNREATSHFAGNGKDPTSFSSAEIA